MGAAIDLVARPERRQNAMRVESNIPEAQSVVASTVQVAVLCGGRQSGIISNAMPYLLSTDCFGVRREIVRHNDNGVRATPLDTAC